MNRNRNHYLLILGSILIISLFLFACSSANNETPVAEDDSNQENQVLLPAVEVNTGSGNETAEDSYPAPEENAETDSYPDLETAAQSDTVGESYPAPEETSPKPTPRGNDLVATDPATVKLASGQLQLVEMFAFW